ncbi:MAG: SMP-30/gluconolactonase/LRE family protein [Puniceicoccaceae bacterium]
MAKQFLTRFGSIAILLCLCTPFLSAAPKLTEKWATGSVFEVPESVCLDPDKKLVYVSNISGSPSEKDGNGFISKVSLEGEVLELKWITGLNAPKGMAVQGRFLYVTDIDVLVRINRETGEILNRYPAKGALFLNDVAADKKGNVITGDSAENSSTLYVLRNDRLQVWRTGEPVNRPNGLSFFGDYLFVGNVGDGELLKVNPRSKSVRSVGNADSRIDGLEPLKDRSFLVSNFLGRISWISAAGELEVLQDTEAEKINAADFEFIEELGLLIVPTFFDNRLVAYTVE